MGYKLSPVLIVSCVGKKITHTESAWDCSPFYSQRNKQNDNISISRKITYDKFRLLVKREETPFLLMNRRFFMDGVLAQFDRSQAI